MCLCVCVIMLRMTLKEFLKHSKESRGVLGQERAQERAQREHLGEHLGEQASRQAGRQACKEAVKHLECIQLEPCPVGACLSSRKF